MPAHPHVGPIQRILPFWPNSTNVALFCPCSFEYESESVSRKMSRAVSASLIRGYERDVDAGVYVLLFNVAFSPGKPLNHKATLVVHSHHSGGVWTFPVNFKVGDELVRKIRT